VTNEAREAGFRLNVARETLVIGDESRLSGVLCCVELQAARCFMHALFVLRIQALRLGGHPREQRREGFLFELIP